MFQHPSSKKRRRSPDSESFALQCGDSHHEPVTKLSRSRTHIAASGVGGDRRLANSSSFLAKQSPAVVGLWDPKLFVQSQQQQHASPSSFSPMVDSTSRHQHVSHLPIGTGVGRKAAADSLLSPAASASASASGSLGGNGGGRRSARHAVVVLPSSKEEMRRRRVPLGLASSSSQGWDAFGLEQKAHIPSRSPTSSSSSSLHRAAAQSDSSSGSDIVVPIIANALDGKVISMRVPITRTVLQLKHMIYEHHTVPVAKQRLVFRGKELCDRQLVRDCVNMANVNAPIMMQLVWRAGR